MEKINLLRFHQKRHRTKKIAAICTTIVFLIFGTLFLSFKFFYATREVNTKVGFFATLSHLILSPEKSFAASRDTVNIALFGIGGAGHEGPNLTDTMLLVSINKNDKRATMVSIPRDLLVDTKRFGKQKINALNALAEAENPGSGAEYAKGVMEEITDSQIDYYARVDFKAFEEIIDAVGGLDIDVPRSFTDPLFPRFDIETQTTVVTFEKGMQHMSGRTALVYARSRHGNNGEGNDFARSRRQQQIMMALKDKVLSSETYLSPVRIKNILDALHNNVKTDFGVWDVIKLAKFYQDLNISPENISVNVLTNGPQGPLYADYYNNQYVLLPKKKDWSDIRSIVANPSDTAPHRYTGDYIDTKKTDEITVSILNGTSVPGLASATAMTLEDFGYRILGFNNAPQKDFEKTVIYNLAGEDKKAALYHIKGLLGANIASQTPEWVKNTVPEGQSPDFIIIIGAPKNSYDQT
jgi:LCP family protein required for cell wall assembly